MVSQGERSAQVRAGDTELLWRAAACPGADPADLACADIGSTINHGGGR
jgi:hypothetical protein